MLFVCLLVQLNIHYIFSLFSVQISVQNHKITETTSKDVVLLPILLTLNKYFPSEFILITDFEHGLAL